MFLDFFWDFYMLKHNVFGKDKTNAKPINI